MRKNTREKRKTKKGKNQHNLKMKYSNSDERIKFNS